jgi:hypothetical protein
VPPFAAASEVREMVRVRASAPADCRKVRRFKRALAFSICKLISFPRSRQLKKRDQQPQV